MAQQRASGAEAEAKAATLPSFDPPGTAINPAGTITGNYSDANGIIHGFLRAPGGTFTTFDLQGSSYTLPQAINPAGTIAGYYLWGGAHGFLRAPGGSFTTFDPQGSTDTQPLAINPAGTIMGLYVDAKGNPHGFLRIPAHRDDDTEGDNTEGGND
jgi:hypothetical protein